MASGATQRTWCIRSAECKYIVPFFSWGCFFYYLIIRDKVFSIYIYIYTEEKKRMTNNYKKTDIDYWNDRGNYFGDEGKYSEAIRCFQKTIKMEPFSYQGYNGMGWILNSIGFYQDAIKILTTNFIKFKL
jgi:tetratricopeptide (TPR) repeat protein